MAAWPKKRHLKAISFGLISGLLGALLALSPWGHRVEEQFGLAWLFHLRGPIAPPDDILVVAVDKASSDALGFPYDTTRWPRATHAQLLDGLRAAGARLVTFDLLFRQPRDDEDAAFAQSIGAAGNVALLEFLAKDQPGAVAHDARLIPVTLQQRVPPAPALAAAAAGSGPFTLPKVPERVSRFWTLDDNAGGAVSLPTVALLLHAQDDYARLRAAAADRAPAEHADLPHSLVTLVAERGVVEAAHVVDALISAATTEQGGDDPKGLAQRALRDLLAGQRGRYLNFYGPPQTLPTIPYADALQLLANPNLRPAFTNKAVFVGVSSPVQWQHQDEFLTVYSDKVSGLDLSGTEILATAFANLRDRHGVTPLNTPGIVVTLLIWGCVLGMVGWLLRPFPALVVVALLTGTYVVVALQLFATQQLWVPVFVPLVVMLPLILFMSALLQHRRARADLNRIRDTFGHYLPRSTVDRLVQEGFQPLTDRRTVFGVCLMTDAQGYTSLAEKIPSDRLVDLVNDYLEVVIGPIQRHGGEVSDIKGDSVLAFWASRQDDLQIRTSACRAVSEIEAAVADWNANNAYGARLPTRVGLHCGTMTLASVGAADHYEQRAVGDIVNTASRLEQLSKDLGTRLLVSEETAKDVDGLVTRYLGSFLLKGRTQKVRVCELLGWGDQRSVADDHWLTAFSTGIDAYERGDWESAARSLAGALELHAKDGVAAWYLDKIAQYRRSETTASD